MTGDGMKDIAFGESFEFGETERRLGGGGESEVVRLCDGDCVEIGDSARMWFSLVP
jgi:hypothetical protein